MKRCKICGDTKPLHQFYKAAGMRDGHRSECIPCDLAAKRARNARDPEANRARARRWQPEERTLHVDHDHETRAIRGLLCFRCNNAIGDFREEYELFLRAANYLDRDDELAALARQRVGALSG